MDHHVHPGERLRRDQSRQPEAHASHPQHHRPQLRFSGGERSQCRVGAQQGLGPRQVDTPLFVQAPVVHGDGDVIQHWPGAGVVEVDQPGQVSAFEHHVVTEQVGVQVGLGQGEDLRLVRGDFRQRRLQQRGLLLVQARQQFGARFQHPVQAPVGAALDDALAGGQVNVRQQLADLGTVLVVRQLDVLARQTRLQQRRLAAQFAQAMPFAVAQGIGHGHVGIVQHVEQFDEERHVFSRPTLDQCEDELPFFQADEEIAVLGTGGDALEVEQAAQLVWRQKGFQLRPGHRGED